MHVFSWGYLFWSDLDLNPLATVFLYFFSPQILFKKTKQNGVKKKIYIFFEMSSILAVRSKGVNPVKYSVPAQWYKVYLYYLCSVRKLYSKLPSTPKALLAAVSKINRSIVVYPCRSQTSLHEDKYIIYSQGRNTLGNAWPLLPFSRVMLTHNSRTTDAWYFSQFP